MAGTMKAVRLHEFGGPEVLHYEAAPKPEPKVGEVLVRVHAVGLNPPDWYLRDGYRSLPPEWQPHPSFPLILGSDVSGVVEAVADGVTGFGVGDEVYAMVRFPTDVMEGSKAYAEYVTVPASELALKPAAIDHVHAAAAPMSLLTAWQFLIDLGHDEPNPFQSFRHAPVPLEGRTVLVNGAGGGVGHLAVQLAKWRGARVIAVASAKNEPLMRELGVDRFIDYKKTPADEVIRDADLVLDAVGGKERGRFFDYGAPTGLRLAMKHPERVTAIVSQNGNAYVEGFSDQWGPWEAYWREPSEANREACRPSLSPETIRNWQYGTGTDPSLLSPDGYELDIAYMARPGAEEIQLDLILDYRSNVALYPAFQAYLREHRPPLLAVWGRHDPAFVPAGAEAYRQDLPDAEVHLIDAGHFALETQHQEIAARMRDFLERRMKA